MYSQKYIKRCLNCHTKEIVQNTNKVCKKCRNFEYFQFIPINNIKGGEIMAKKKSVKVKEVQEMEEQQPIVKKQNVMKTRIENAEKVLEFITNTLELDKKEASKVLSNAYYKNNPRKK
jgi:hypothetical protein